jgi:hypothetical protein
LHWPVLLPWECAGSKVHLKSPTSVLLTRWSAHTAADLHVYCKSLESLTPGQDRMKHMKQEGLAVLMVQSGASSVDTM